MNGTYWWHFVAQEATSHCASLTPMTHQNGLLSIKWLKVASVSINFQTEVLELWQNSMVSMVQVDKLWSWRPFWGPGTHWPTPRSRTPQRCSIGNVSGRKTHVFKEVPADPGGVQARMVLLEGQMKDFTKGHNSWFEELILVILAIQVAINEMKTRVLSITNARPQHHSRLLHHLSHLWPSEKRHKSTKVHFLCPLSVR